MLNAPAFAPTPPLSGSSFLSQKHVCSRLSPARKSHHVHTASPPALVNILQEPQSEPTEATPVSFTLETSALQEAIKAIAVGKNGEKPIPPAIIPRCAEELAHAEQPDAPPELLYLRASFLGSLFVKSSLTPGEHALLASGVRRATAAGINGGRVVRAADAPQNTPGVSAAEVVSTVYAAEEREGDEAGDERLQLVDALAPSAYRLLGGERLTRAEARALGGALFAPHSMHPLKALIAHVMRVRHENADELSGLAQAVAAASRHARPGVAAGRRVALVAEPYDGTLTWDLLTPLVCRHLAMHYGLLPVMGVGKSGGPKRGPNLRDVTRELGVARWGGRRHDDPTTSDWLDKEDETRAFGLVAEQADVVAGLADWTWMRRVIVKRPAIATVEKYADVSPDGSRLFIASAFHPGYVEKMALAAQAVGFAAYIIVGRGMEGSIGLGAGNRQSRLLIGWRVDIGGAESYREENFAFQGTEEVEGPVPAKGSVTAKATARKIERYVEEGTSGDAVFDARARTTLQAMDQAMAILRQAAPHVLA